MLAVGAIDLEHRIIPNKITYPAFPAFAVAIALGWAIGQDLDPIRALIGALAYGGAFLLIAVIAPRGLGMGDVKLTALIGLVMGSLGLRYVGVAAGAAILLGGVGGILALLAGRGRKSAIPFGPFLTAGALVAVFWGERIAAWYLRSFPG
jgi:leader peptidase (prepilin peptidase)/N-methyltransferase